MKDKYFNKVIMKLNAWRILTRKEKIFDYIYATFMVISFIGVPLVAIPVFAAFGKLVSGLLISVLVYAISLTIGIFRRNCIIRRFYKIESIEGKIKIVPVEDLTVLDELYKSSALTFVASFLCIPLSELNITAENVRKFGNEYTTVGAQYFDKMIDTWVDAF